VDVISIFALNLRYAKELRGKEKEEISLVRNSFTSFVVLSLE
jgi:hypothetical protein